MRLIIAAAALLLAGVLSAVSVNGAGAQDGSVCALLTDDRRRLDCYDLLFKPPSEEGTASPIKGRGKAGAGKGKWTIREAISKLDDSRNVFVSVSAAQPYINWLGESKSSSLTIACREGATNLWIDFGTTMGLGPLVYRIDKNPAGSLEVRHSTNYEALGIWEQEEAVEFTKQLLNAEHLLVRAIPSGASAIDVEFPVAGLGEAIHPLREACRW